MIASADSVSASRVPTVLFWFVLFSVALCLAAWIGPPPRDDISSVSWRRRSHLFNRKTTSSSDRKDTSSGSVVSFSHLSNSDRSPDTLLPLLSGDQGAQWSYSGAGQLERDPNIYCEEVSLSQMHSFLNNKDRNGLQSTWKLMVAIFFSLNLTCLISHQRGNFIS